MEYIYRAGTGSFEAKSSWRLNKYACMCCLDVASIIIDDDVVVLFFVFALAMWHVATGPQCMEDGGARSRVHF